MSAQTAGGVVIRERVSVTQPAVRGVAPDCTAPVVAEVVFRGGNWRSPWVSRSPLSGTLTVETTCGGGATGALTAGFAPAGIWPNHDGGADRYLYTALDSAEIVRVPLRATDGYTATVDLPGEGFPRTANSGDVEFGCNPGYYNYGTCITQSTYANPSGNFGFRTEITGYATGSAHAWPDTVACGTTTPLPIRLTKPDGSEGYVGPRSAQTFELPSADPAVRGVLAYDGATRGVFYGVPYGESRAGAVAFVAPACEVLSRPTGATIWVTGLPGGTLLSGFINVVLPPPDRFVVTATPDTLDAGNETRVTSVAFGGAREAYLDPETAVTLSVSPASAGYLAYVLPYTRPVEGTTLTVPYDRSFGYFSAGARSGLILVRTGPPPDVDQTVTITAEGGGLSGTGQIVLLGRLRLELDASPDSVATGGTSTLTATLAGRGAAAFDPNATLTFALDSPSLGTLRRASTQETGTTLTRVPRAEAASGGVAFVAVARQAPPARGTALARGDSTAADSVWASARVTATVDGHANLTDTARIAVGGTSGLSVDLVCTGSGTARMCTVRVDLPGGLCDTAATMQVSVRGARGTLVVASTGERIAVGEGGATVTVQTAEALAGGVTFEPDATGTIRIGTVTVGFGAPAFTCDGEPILPGEASVASGPLPACTPGQARGAAAQLCIPTDDGGSPTVRLFDQGGYVVDDGYVMVSKVRPDWMLPTGELPFDAPYEGAAPLPDGSVPTPCPEMNPACGALRYYDRHTYRPEVGGLPRAVDTRSLVFGVTVHREGVLVPISVNGTEIASGTQQYTHATFAPVCKVTEGGTQTCRSKQYIRFVSNSGGVKISV